MVDNSSPCHLFYANAIEKSYMLNIVWILAWNLKRKRYLWTLSEMLLLTCY
jgi:hypothetical protein